MPQSLRLRLVSTLLAMVLAFLSMASPRRAHGAGQTPVVTLALSASSVPAGTVVIQKASVSDVNGPVAGGLVDFFDGSQLIASVQVVHSASAGYAVGSATLRRVFAPGSHSFHAAFRGTVSDGPASSAVSTLLVGPASLPSSSALVYAGTRDMTQQTNYNFLSGIAAADFNQDGIPDIAAIQFEPTVLAVSLADAANPGHFLAPNFVLATGDEFDRLTAVDFDADGLIDLIVQDSDNDLLYLFHNNPANPGNFTTPTVLQMGTFAVADFNRDGLPDIIGSNVINGKLVLTTLLNNPAQPGQFLPGAAFATPAGAYVLGNIASADMNGDGFPDVVYTCVGTSNNLLLVVMLGDPANTGAFLSGTVYPYGGNSISVGDVNLDGLPDVLVQEANGFDVLLGDPAHPGALQAPISVAGPVSEVPAIGDVNGDGKPDAVVGYLDNTIRIFAGNGDGTFQPPVVLMTGPTAPAWENSGIALVDIDGDGLLDMLTSSLRQNAVQSFRHQVTGTPLIRTSTDLSLSTGYVVLQNQTEVVTATESATSGTPAGSVEFYDTFGGDTYISIGTAPILNGTAVMKLTNLQLGYHDFVLAFHGDSLYAPSESIISGIIVKPSGSSSATTLSATPNPTGYGQPISLFATVAGTGSVAGPPTGSVQFFDGTTSLGTTGLAGGNATLTVSTLSSGTHSITAVYSGDSTFSGSTSPAVSVIVQGVVSAVLLAANHNPAPFGAAVAFSVEVSSAGGIPSGTVNFFDGSSSLGSATLSSAGSATLAVSNLSPGIHAISAVYSGDLTHNSATSNVVSESIGLASSSLTLVATPSSAAAFQPIQLQATVGPFSTVPGASLSGTVTFFANGMSVGTASAGASGLATLSTGTLGSGSYPLTAAFAGNAAYSASTSNTVPETIRADTTSVRLAVSPNPALQQQQVSYSIIVAPALGSQAPNGVVTLAEGAAILGSGSLNAQGTLTAPLSALAPGTHLLTAMYAGNSNFQASTSIPVSLQILAEDFDLSSSASTISIQTEHHAPLTVSVVGVGGLQDAVDLSCTGLPAHATCTFASSRLGIGAATASTRLMIDTDDVLYYARSDPAAEHSRSGPVYAWILAGSLSVFGFMLPAGRRRKRLLPWLAICALAAMSLPMSLGCSGKYPAHTAPGQYNINVVAQAEQTGIAHTAAVTLDVLP